MLPPPPLKHAKHTIKGPAGQLEVLTTVPTTQSPQKSLGIICHPHSLQGGTMHNKVIHTLSGALNRLGIPTVRFNFRGVGNSSGQYDDGIGETEDCIAVAKWGQATFNTNSCILAGFSFGAFVSQRAAANINPVQLISIAPPVNHYDYQSLPPVSCRWLVIHGEQDEVVPYQEMLAWHKTLKPQPTLITLPDTTHFFHGKLIILRELLQQHIITES